MSERLLNDLYPYLFALLVALLGLITTGIGTLAVMIKNKWAQSNLANASADLTQTAALQQKAAVVVKSVEQDAQKGSASTANADMHDEGMARLANLAPGTPPETMDAAIKSAVYSMNQARDAAQGPPLVPLPEFPHQSE